jgi:hypothetical protein
MRKVLLTLILAFSYISSFAQKEERILLSEYIQTIEKEFNLVFSYNPELLENIKIDLITEDNVTEIINQLNSTSAFKFELINTDNIVISSKKENNNLLIEGTVLVDKNEPLFGAYIRIHNQKAYTTTQLDGSFKLLCKLNLIDSLEISYIGFKTKKIALTDVNNGKTSDFHLDESSLLINEFNVIAYTTSGVIYNKEDQSIELTPESAGLLPGETETDIYNSLQYLPGINSPTGKAGNLTMRGTDPDKTLITFDNIPIYHSGHYFGTFSPFNTKMIENVKIQRNGSHGSERGGRVGGLIEIKSKTHILDSAQYNIGVSTSYFSGNAQIPIIKNKLGILIGGRHSYPGEWNSPKIEAINDFIYQRSPVGAARTGNEDFDLKYYDYAFNDLNTKIIYQIHKNHKVSLSFLNIDNELGYSTFFDPNQTVSKDSASLNNWGGNLSISNKWSDKINTTTDFTNSYYNQELSRNINDSNDLLSSISSYKNQTRDFKIKTNLEITLKKKQYINFGYQMDYHNLNYSYLNYTAAGAAVPGGPPGPPPTPASPELTQLLEIPTESYLHTGYINYKILNYDKLFTISAGLRTSYYTPTKKFYPEPRVLINMLLSSYFTIKTNVGIYNQFINHIVGKRVSPIGGIEAPFWQLSNNSDIKVVQGKQVMFGGIWSENNLVFDVEAYYKLIDNITANNFLDLNSNQEFIYGNYKNYGVDVLLKKKFKNIEGWLSYSYSQSNAIFDSVQFQYIWNQSHILSAVLGYKFKNLKFSAGWHYKSGLAVLNDIRASYTVGTPVFPGTNSGPSNNNNNNVGNRVFTEDSPEEYIDNFPNTHQLDVSIAYSIIPKTNKWNLTLGIGAQNVYNTKSIYSQGISPAGSEYPRGTFRRFHKYGLGFAPSVMLNFSW